MRKLFVVLSLVVSASANAAESQHWQTVAPENARYEIVESTRWTFKLDRFSGEVWQMVWTADNRKTWVNLPVPGLNAGKKAKPRFQMFASGLAARQFLLDTETGTTWTIEDNKDAAGKDVLTWVPFVEAK